MLINILEIQQLDLSHLYGYLNETYIRYFQEKRSYYKLLYFLAGEFDDRIILDVGTCTGASAIALSNKNRVLTFDIQEEDRFAFKDLPITSFLCNMHNIDEDLIKESPLIYLDVAHNGEDEIKFYNRLKDLDYDGILVVDDICLNYKMKEFWGMITNIKYDLTDFFHESGTGIVDFSGKIEVRKSHAR